MKVNEIEINGKIYRTCYIENKSDINVCDSCDLKSQCNIDLDEKIRDMCLNDFPCYFKEVKQKENITNKFYTFSSGTVFNTNYIKDIIDIGYVETCPIELDKHSFSVLLSNKLIIHFRFDTKTIATRERNKFIKFIERYEYTNNSN